MKTRDLLLTIVVVAIVAISYLWINSHKISPSQIATGSNSVLATPAGAATQASPVAAGQSDTEAKAAAQLAGNKQADTLTRDNETDLHPGKYASENTPESSRLTTKKGTIIKPNKYAKAVVFEDDGDKGLAISPESLGLPKLVGDMKYFLCQGSANLPLSEYKSRAEAADRCAYFDYALAALNEIKSGNPDMTKDRESWREKLKPLMDYLLKAAVDGNYWSAAELGCYFANPPFDDKTEGLSWLIISAEMHNSAYIWEGDCTGTFLSEPEETYTDAIERAKFYIDFYGFSLRQNL